MFKDPDSGVSLVKYKGSAYLWFVIPNSGAGLLKAFQKGESHEIMQLWAVGVRVATIIKPAQGNTILFSQIITPEESDQK